MKSLVYSAIAAPIGALLILGAGPVYANGGHWHGHRHGHWHWYHCDAVVSPPGSIQAAIDAASPGDKICIKNGTYTEDLNIATDGLTLEGQGKHTVVMGVQTVPSGSFPLAGSPGAPLGNLNVDANDVTVKKLTIKLASGGATAYSAGITVNGTDVTFERNHIVAPGGTPGTVAFQTWVTAPGGSDISGLTIARNRFSGAAGDGFGYEAIFINPQAAPVDPANPVRIEMNRFSGDMYRAVGTVRASVVVKRNAMRTDLAGPLTTADFGDVPWGVKVFDGSGVVLAKNALTDRGAGVFNVGLALAGGSGTAEKNYVRGAATTGVDVDASGWTLQRNAASDGAGDGFDVSGTGNTLTRNWSWDNTGFGIVETGSGNTYTRNRCRGNGAGASSPAGLC